MYKNLSTDSTGLDAKTCLYYEQKNEPYNGGIIFNPTPPNKRFTYDPEYIIFIFSNL